MASLFKSLRRDAKSDVVENTQSRNTASDDAEPGRAQEELEVTVDGSSPKEVNENAQKGVQEMEATTLTWSKPALISLFIG